MRQSSGFFAVLFPPWQLEEQEEGPQGQPQQTMSLAAMSRILLTVLSSLSCSLLLAAPAGESIKPVNLSSATAAYIMETPDKGIQPRLVNDPDGGLHLLYFKKRLPNPDAREGNLYYRRYDANTGEWGRAVKVSSRAFAMQTFSISRASLAVTADGRAHVVWYLPRQAEYHYARSDSEGQRFEAQRSIISTYTEGLDAAADVAAFGDQVAIVWGAGALTAEAERSVYGRASADSGKTFGEEQLLGDKTLGACACCSLAAEFAKGNALQIAYRSAINGIGRHMQLVTIAADSLMGESDSATDSEAPRRYAEPGEFQQWELSACPLSTNDFYADGDTNWLAFENESRTALLAVDSEGEYVQIAKTLAEPIIKTRQKNPVIAVNRNQEKLVVWGEAISHSKGGRLNFSFLDQEGILQELVVHPDFDSGFYSDDNGETDPVIVRDYSFPAVGVLPNGDFLVLH